MENQVLSIEQMQKLKELGVDVSPGGICFHYRFDGGNTHRLEFAPSYCSDDIKAFTLQDIIELLPTTIHTDGGFFYLTIMRTCIFYHFIYEDDNRILNKEFDDCIMQSAYEMLLWVAENGYLTSK